MVAACFDTGTPRDKRLEKDMIWVGPGWYAPMMAMASRDYPARHGTLKRPEDLRQLSLADPCNPLPMGVRVKAMRRLRCLSTPPLIVGDVDLMVQAAIDGSGIACMLDLQAVPLAEKIGNANLR